MCWVTLLLAALITTPLSAGEITERFELTRERVLNGAAPRYDEALLLADVIPEPTRRFTNFSGDLSGRYIGALALTAPTGEALPVFLDLLVGKVIERQRPDGHFGDPMGAAAIVNDDFARLWGNGRMLIGLLEYYRVRRRPEVLEAARRLGDFLVAVAPRFNASAVQSLYSRGKFATGYVCWTQNIEGLVELYRLTKDARYLDLAKEMALRTERQSGEHSHGFLSSLRGILELAEAAGEEKYLRQVEREWEGLIESGNVLVQGAVPEALAPAIERDEGCSEADWLRLNLTLWRRTGQARYLEHAERTLFNEFCLNQFSSGDFGHVQLTEAGLGFGTGRAWWCCTLHGLRAFAAIRQAAFREEGGTLHYDLPIEGSEEIEGFSVRARSSLETDASVTIEVAEADAAPHTVAIRVPAWVREIDAAVGGASYKGVPAQGEIAIERVWRAGDRVEIHYAMLTQVRKRDAKRETTAIFHGPWLLALAEVTEPSFFNEPYPNYQVLLPLTAPDGVLNMEPQAAVPGRFAIPAARHRLPFLPPGYPQPETATLRPVAERTGLSSPGRWQIWFATDPPQPKTNGGLAAVVRDWGPAFLLAAAAAVLFTTGMWRRRRRRAPG